MRGSLKTRINKIHKSIYVDCASQICITLDGKTIKESPVPKHYKRMVKIVVKL